MLGSHVDDERSVHGRPGEQRQAGCGEQEPDCEGLP